MAAALSPSSTRYPVGLAVASLAWAIVGWLGATLAPQLAFLPGIEILHALLPGVTLALIVVNLGYALQAVFRHRVPIERLLLVTTAQLALFTTLFFQIDAHFEANCYWTESPTDPWMWLGFSAAHALRASDILDTVEAFDLNIQVVKHRHPLVAGLVVLYHIVVYLLMLGLFRVVMSDFWNRRIGNNEARWTIVMRTSLILFGIWLLVWLSCAFYFRPWNSVDIPIWLVENVVRVIDFLDIMDSFDLHWHQVPKEPLECTLTFFCRVWIVLGISLFLRWRTTHARIQPLPQPNSSVSLWRLWPLLVVPSILFGCGIAIDRLLKQANDQAVATLIEAATGEDQGRSEKALAALRRMGPNALSALEPLYEECLHNPDRATVAIQTLAHLGPKALPALEAIAINPANEGRLAIEVEENEPVIEAVVTSLRKIGPSAAPILVRIWSQTRLPRVKKRIDAILFGMGPDAVRPLIISMTSKNVIQHSIWIRELDRNWYLRNSRDSQIFTEVKEVYSSAQELQSLSRESKHRAFDKLQRNPLTRASMPLPAWIAALRKADMRFKDRIKTLIRLPSFMLAETEMPALIGLFSESDAYCKIVIIEAYNLKALNPANSLIIQKGAFRQFIPTLITALKDPDSEVRMAAAEGLGYSGSALAVPELISALNDSDWRVRGFARSALGRIGKEAVPALIAALKDTKHSVREEAARALGDMGAAAEEAIPALLAARKDPDSDVRQAAAEALKRIRGH